MPFWDWVTGGDLLVTRLSSLDKRAVAVSSRSDHTGHDLLGFGLIRRRGECADGGVGAGKQAGHDEADRGGARR